MKFLFYALMLLFCTISNAGDASLMKCSVASGQNQENYHKNIFVDSSKIHFSGHEVFVELNHEMIQLNSLCGDYRGVFIEYNAPHNVAYWVCPKCGQQNPLWSLPYCNTEWCDYVVPFIPH